MFAGVLDQGDDEVFLGGTKLKRFLESVDQVTTAIPAAMPTEPQPATETAAKAAAADELVEAAEVIEAITPQQQLWRDVAAAGQSLLEKVSEALTAGGADRQHPAAARGLNGLIARDRQSGQSYLKLPLPEPEVMQKLVALFQAFTGKGR
jgi:hypothetical protein